MKKILIAVVILLVSAASSFSEGTAVKLKDGKIIMESPEGTKALDYSAKDKYVPVQSKKWKVDTETDPVQEALKVFKSKEEPSYKQRVWITSKSDGTEKIYVEYRSKDKEPGLIFSPNEDYAYYWGLSDEGVSIVYGIDLSDESSFSFGSAGKELEYSEENRKKIRNKIDLTNFIITYDY